MLGVKKPKETETNDTKEGKFESSIDNNTAKKISSDMEKQFEQARNRKYQLGNRAGL